MYLYGITSHSCSSYKKKFSNEIITQFAESLLDDTVFEIVKGLEDIQLLSERNLLNRRMKILSEQKGKPFSVSWHAPMYDAKLFLMNDRQLLLSSLMCSLKKYRAAVMAAFLQIVTPSFKISC